MLELRSISKSFGSFKLSDASVRIDDGEYFVLLGPSGVGKTVLIEIIAGLIKPDSGQILWDDKDITFATPESRGFAVVYQDYALFPHLTVQENIAYGLKAAGRGSAKKTNRIKPLAEMLRITELLDRRPTNLSGGEQQRVALARALAVEPKLLLLDEPLSAVDANNRVRLRKELKRINKELGVAVLHVTHDPQEAIVLADKVCVMLDNKVRQVAAPRQLFREPCDHEVADFLGMKNVLPVSRAENGLCVACGEDIYASSADDLTSYIWIKPEEIVLSSKPFSSSARNQFQCRVVGLDRHESLLTVHVKSGELPLAALITYASFDKLQIEANAQVYATFKSSAVHSF